MDDLEAAEFLVDKIRATKNNGDFLRFDAQGLTKDYRTGKLVQARDFLDNFAPPNAPRRPRTTP